MSEIISRELLGEVLRRDCNISHLSVNDLIYEEITTENRYIGLIGINIYELAHMKLKQWAKLKNIFDKIDWSEEPEQIFIKAEELRNEINQRLRCC